MSELLPVGTKYVSHKDGKSFVGDGITRFPEPAEEDLFYTKDYCYRFIENTIGCFGWGVKVINSSKKSYSQLLEMINGYPLLSMQNTFFECKKMKIAPVIPKTVEFMNFTFHGCKLLKEPPIIPAGVISMYCTFKNCRALVSAPIIPESVQDIVNVLYDCKNLKGTLRCEADVTLTEGAIRFTGISKIEGCSEETKKRILASKI